MKTWKIRNVVKLHKCLNNLDIKIEKIELDKIIVSWTRYHYEVSFDSKSCLYIINLHTLEVNIYETKADWRKIYKALSHFFRQEKWYNEL